jgi:arylsulfatase
LRPALLGEDIKRGKPIFWEHEGNRAVREGQWKVVALEGKPWRLYDLAADRTEQRDLAAGQPERVKALAAKWDEWAAQSNVLPLGGWRGESKTKGLSKKASFTLNQGDHLDREEAPAVPNRGFRIAATMDVQKPEGVIVAQGGTAHGYALYLDQGKLTFVVRSEGKVAPIVATTDMKGSHAVLAQLKPDGTMQLSVDGKPAAEGKSELISKMPVDGLDVGTDEGGLVGTYGERNEFGGAIKSLSIELEPKAAK